MYVFNKLFFWPLVDPLFLDEVFLDFLDDRFVSNGMNFFPFTIFINDFLPRSFTIGSASIFGSSLDPSSLLSSLIAPSDCFLS